MSERETAAKVFTTSAVFILTKAGEVIARYLKGGLADSTLKLL